MKKWEYKSFQGKLVDEQLNVLGLQGWELVGHTAVTSSGELYQYYVFKRDIKP